MLTAGAVTPANTRHTAVASFDYIAVGHYYSIPPVCWSFISDITVSILCLKSSVLNPVHQLTVASH